jgi:HTH-type transcriptional regulator / antitoxin MqsA
MKAGDSCPLCGHVVRKRITTEIFEYRGEFFNYPNYIIYLCDSCEEAFVDTITMKESGKAIREFYKQVDGELSPSSRGAGIACDPVQR